MTKKRENSRFALIVGATILTLLGSAGKVIAFHPAAGHTYEVLVTSSLGSSFPDCYRYNADGTLIIDNLGIPGVYDHDELGEANRRTQGINADAVFGLATHALHPHSFTEVSGNAIGTDGVTYTFDGIENPGCVAGPVGPIPSNPYNQP